MLPLACRSAALRRRTGRSRLIRWLAGFGDPTAKGSLFGSGSTGDLVIPFTVEGTGPSGRDGSVDHRRETSFFQERGHVNVNEEEANSDQRYASVNQDRHIAHNVETPRNGFNVPEHKAGKQKKNRAANHGPKVDFLSPVEASDWREFVVVIIYVGFDVICPDAIVVIHFHVAGPVQEHEELGNGEEQTEPWVPESSCWPDRKSVV